MSIWTKNFWKDASERAFFTAVETLLSVITVDGFDIINLDVQATVALVGVATLAALLKGIVAAHATGDSISPASAFQEVE